MLVAEGGVEIEPRNRKRLGRRFLSSAAPATFSQVVGVAAAQNQREPCSRPFPTQVVEANLRHVLHNLSQETLAEIVGTTRSRVNFFMNKFRDLGFIEYNGGLKVNSSLLSVVLHD